MNLKTYKIKCAYCGKEFEAAAYWARYCSESHRKMDYEKRRKEQQKQNSKPSK